MEHAIISIAIIISMIFALSVIIGTMVVSGIFIIAESLKGIIDELKTKQNNKEE